MFWVLKHFGVGADHATEVLPTQDPDPRPKNRSRFCSGPVGGKKGSDPEPGKQATSPNRLRKVKVLTLRCPKPAPKTDQAQRVLRTAPLRRWTMNPTDLKGPSVDLKGTEAGTQKPKSVLLRTCWWKKGSDPEPEKKQFHPIDFERSGC